MKRFLSSERTMPQVKKEELLQVDGLTVRLTRKEVRYLRLRLLPEGTLGGTIPWLMPLEEAEAFIRSRLPQLRPRLEQLRLQQDNPDCGLRGDYVWLWGRRYAVLMGDTLQSDGRETARFDGSCFWLHSDRELTAERRERLLLDELARLITARTEELFSYWQLRMNLHHNGWQLRVMRSRWGSCNVRRRTIHINFRLVFRPPECLEYVVVHELAHIYEASHSRRFWDFVGCFLPDYRERRRLLNDFLFLSE